MYASMCVCMRMCRYVCLYLTFVTCFSGTNISYHVLSCLSNILSCSVCDGKIIENLVLYCDGLWEYVYTYSTVCMYYVCVYVCVCVCVW